MNNFKNMFQSEEDTLCESSLSNIVRKINKDDTAIAMITPFRATTSDDNEKYYKEVASEIKNNDWNFLYMNGGYIENENTPNERVVKEKSFFIEVSLEEETLLWKWCIDTAQKYKQDAFLFKSKNHPFGSYSKRGHTVFLFKKSTYQTEPNKVNRSKGKEQELYKITSSDVKSFYSAMKTGQHKNRKFLFESVDVNVVENSFGAMVRKYWMEN